MLGGAEFLATLARMSAEPATRELLASLEDVWGFLAEPYHLSDWWPGIVSVAARPARLRDRRALAGHCDRRSRSASGRSASRASDVRADRARNGRS